MDGVGSDVKVEVSSARSARRVGLLLRLLGLAFTLVAAVVGGVNKETQIIPLPLLNGLPPVLLPVTAKWHYLSAFVYFVVSNAIACSYAAASLALSSTVTRNREKGTALALLITDLIMVALLFSANGAASAVGLIGLKGNSHVRWEKVCHVFNNFCRHGTAAIVMSMLGSFVFLWLVVLAALNLHKKI